MRAAYVGMEERERRAAKEQATATMGDSTATITIQPRQQPVSSAPKVDANDLMPCELAPSSAARKPAAEPRVLRAHRQGLRLQEASTHHHQPTPWRGTSWRSLLDAPASSGDRPSRGEMRVACPAPPARILFRQPLPGGAAPLLSGPRSEKYQRTGPVVASPPRRSRPSSAPVAGSTMPTMPTWSCVGCRSWPGGAAAHDGHGRQLAVRKVSELFKHS